jgi:hypothetical protein
MKKWNVAAVKAAKGVQKLGCVTAYAACFARLLTNLGAKSEVTPNLYSGLRTSFDPYEFVFW